MEETGKIIITINSTDYSYDYDQLGVDFEASDEAIVDALTPLLEEEEGFNLREEFNHGGYTVKRMDNSRNIYVFPKSTAGL